MLRWTPVLTAIDRVRFLRDERFLDSRGADPARYWVGPLDEMPPVDATLPIAIGYDGRRFEDGGFLAVTTLAMRDGGVELRSTLLTAMALLTYLFDEPDHLVQLRAIDPAQPATAVLAALGVPSANVLKDGVGQYEPGEYLAPHEPGWRLFVVEPHGEITVVADSARPAPLAYLLAAEQQQQRSNLAERVAAFIPPDAPAMLKD